MKTDMIRFVLRKPGLIEREVAPVPTPEKGEVLVQVTHCGVCGSDPTIYHGLHPYAISPLVMGHEFSGYVAVRGEGVGSPKEGTRVTVIPHLVCGECEPCRNKVFNFCEKLRCMGAEANGAHCEYIAVPAIMTVPISGAMSLEQAALIEPAAVAYHGARRGEVVRGDIALVVGAGPIGNFAMQSCKALGAKKVIMADMLDSRLELARSCGADGTINTSRTPLEDGLRELVGDPKAVDLFYDCVGGKGEVLNRIISVARRGSRIVVIGVLQKGTEVPSLPDFVQHELRLSGTTMYVPQDYRDVISLMAKRKIRTEGIITHHFDFEDLPKAFEMIDARKEPFFKIMINVSPEDK
jgi:L-iditol 2-dehydrogenase